MNPSTWRPSRSASSRYRSTGPTPELSALLLEVRVQEADRLHPGPGGRLGVVDLGTGVVEERVVDAGVHLEVALLAERVQRLLEVVDLVRREEPVVAGVVTEHRG